MTMPGSRKAEGDWAYCFSDHSMEPVLDRAEGIYLYDEEGNRFIDASGGPLAVNLGHGDPRIKSAAVAQMERFSYCHPTLSNRPRAELCRKIAEVAPGSLNATYLVCGGSEAVETAMKIARQYHVLQGHANKHQIISNRDSYHGMTLATLAVSGSPGNQRHFEPMLQKWPKVPQYSPYAKPRDVDEKEWALRCAEQLEIAIHYAGPQSVAAYLATPVGCGSDYGVVPPTEYWQAVRDICDQNDILFIADEVVTGFGRTGKWFCMEHFGSVQADIMTTGKGISSLYAPLGAVTVSDKVNEPFAAGAAFIHGFTNGGHPVGAAVGSAVIDVIREDGLVENAAEVGDYFELKLDQLRSHPTVADMRGVGLLRVGELVKEKETMTFFEREEHAEQRFQATALRNGLAFYGTLYGSRRAPGLRRGLPLFLMPPICITRAEIDDLVERLDATLSEWEESLGVA